MRVRTALKTAFKDAIALALPPERVPAVPIEKWDGEEEVFNSAHGWPGLSLVSDGIDFGEREEISEEVATYQRDHIFHVFVYAAHVPNGSAGDEIAEAIMDDLEAGVAGQLIGGLGLAEIIGEKRVHVHMGRCLYVQAWKITLLESH